MQRTDDFTKSQMVEAAWKYGSHYGGHNAMIMILHVIKNRQARGWGTFLDIVERMPKYEAAPPPVQTFPQIWDRNFLKVLSEVDSIYDGTAKDIINGALYFGDTNNIKNQWFLDNIARNPEHQRVADMNTLVFWN